MFERFTEKARRVIFFARYEASQFGSPYIETEHLMLAILREDRRLTLRFLRSSGPLESIRREIEASTLSREKTSTSIDLPLSNESKRVLAYASDEADKLGHKHIGTEHLLLGLLREEPCFAAKLLHSRGVQLAAVREELRRVGPQFESSSPPKGPREPDILAEFSLNLSEAALDGQLDPLIGRDAQLDQILQILARRTDHNAVLIGPPGVGKKTIVSGLAQRIVDGTAPPAFNDLLVISLNLPELAAGDRRGLSAERMQDVLSKARAIYVLDELHTPSPSSSTLLHLLKPLVLSNQIRCISLTTPSAYDASVQQRPWLQTSFQTVAVPPSTEAETVEVLRGLKDRFEKFHSVTYSDEALTAAAHYANKLLPGHLPGKAVGLLDEAGASTNQKPLSEEIRNLQKTLRATIRHLQAAIQNHEFEKARFYSTEEQMQRGHLKLEIEKYGAATALEKALTRDHIEATLSRMTGLSSDTIKKLSPNNPAS
jgi:ATP-dependent Clp protease ATP-binding subunit ClpC